MHYGLCTCASHKQCTLYHHHDTKKTQDSIAFTKPLVEKMLKSGIVYRLTCPRCFACYVGETNRLLKFRVREYIQRAGSMKSHLSQCGTTITEENMDILQTSSRGEYYLLTLEALHIRGLKPQTNTRNEYKSREIMIKL